MAMTTVRFVPFRRSSATAACAKPFAGGGGREKRSPEIQPTIQKGRTLGANMSKMTRLTREKMWADAAAMEDSIADSYMETVKSGQDIERIEERARFVLRTNQELMEQICEQDSIVNDLQKENKAKQRAWDALVAELKQCKMQQANKDAQLRLLAEQRLAEERRLRDRSVALRSRLAALRRESVRFQDARRHEEQQISQRRAAIAELKLKIRSVQAKKADLECDFELDAGEESSSEDTPENDHNSEGRGSSSSWGRGRSPDTEESPPVSRSSSKESSKVTVTAPTLQTIQALANLVPQAPAGVPSSRVARVTQRSTGAPASATLLLKRSFTRG